MSATPYSHFQPIGELPSERGFTVWGYATRETEEDVRKPGYFQPKSHHIADGDLMVVNCKPYGTSGSQATKVLFLLEKDANGRVILHDLLRLSPPKPKRANIGAVKPA